MAPQVVLAHGSGVDEALGLIIPAVIVGALWLWGKKRRPLADEDDAPEEDPTDPPG